MAHTITIKLQKPAREFAAGDSIGFGIRGGVRYYDRKSQRNEFTNYQAVIFAKEGKQAEFYREVLTEGAIVEVFGESIKVDAYDGQNGQSITLELNNARLGFIEAGNKQGKPQQQESGRSSTPQISSNGDSNMRRDSSRRRTKAANHQWTLMMTSPSDQ